MFDVVLRTVVVSYNVYNVSRSICYPRVFWVKVEIINFNDGRYDTDGNRLFALARTIMLKNFDINET